MNEHFWHTLSTSEGCNVEEEGGQERLEYGDLLTM